MIRTTEAIFADGVLKPVEPLNLREQQRVRITVEEVETAPPDREAAVRRMVEGFKKLRLLTNGRMPTREELHERD